MELISDYMRDDSCRHMLNDLTRRVFRFDFENWVTQGYFEGEYIPYSLTEGGRIFSNVSANRMRFLQNGTEKYYVQLGTVMTDEKYRKQGLAARLIRHVISVYEQECDGIYLFGNLDALGFYEKMGFQTINQYRYYVREEFLNRGVRTVFQAVSDLGDSVKGHYLEMVRDCPDRSSFAQTNKYGLQMFYTGEFDQVYYAEDIDCFIVLEQGEETILQSVLCRDRVPLAGVLDRINLSGRTCALGFVPLSEDMNICRSEEYDGADDYRLFYLGSQLEAIERDRLYFPELSHA